MQINHPTTLTLEDYTQLERLMCTLTGSRTPFAALVRRKLETAVIVHGESAGEDLVTSGRRVRYWVNGARRAEGVLSWDRSRAGDTSRISLQDSDGLALLGMRAGQAMSYAKEGGIVTVEVENVTLPTGDPSNSERGQAAPHPPATRRKRGNTIASIKRYLKAGLSRIQKGRTEAALARLSDAALRDIGITRGEISHVASIVAGVLPEASPEQAQAHADDAGHKPHLRSGFGPKVKGSNEDGNMIPPTGGTEDRQRA